MYIPLQSSLDDLSLRDQISTNGTKHVKEIGVGNEDVLSMFVFVVVSRLKFFGLAALINFVII